MGSGFCFLQKGKSLKEKTKKNLEKYCSMTGQTEEIVIDLALGQFLAPFVPDEGYPIKAELLSGITRYERKVAQNEGRKVTVTKEPCFVLGALTIFGAPYYRIISDGRLMKVPKECIEFAEK